ncbi:calcium-binding protein, partial [Persephonella sp.]|uniref:calcium-binding protein n=1 Tax=Persephonella sp. TaxID=2060922 RepID=UPI00260F9D29
LDGDGIETIGLDSSNAMFDLDGDGFREKTGWISKDDGILVIDKNGDGKINDVNEVFGNQQIDGFTELSQYDSNNDGIIDNQDNQFNNIKVWQDLDSDGIVDEGELKDLTEAGIKQINLENQQTTEDSNGNEITHRGTFVKTDGTTGEVADVNFKMNQTFTSYNGEINISPDVIFLPWLRGYGEVKDLPIAMSENQEIKEIVINIAKATDLGSIYTQLEELIMKWAGVDNIPEGEMRGAVENRIISVVEKFLGIKYERRVIEADPTHRAGRLLSIEIEEVSNSDFENKTVGDSVNGYVITKDTITTEVIDYDKAKILEIYDSIKNMFFINLVSQTGLGKELGISYDFVKDNVSVDLNRFINVLENTDDDGLLYSSHIVKALYKTNKITMTQIFNIDSLTKNVDLIKYILDTDNVSIGGTGNDEIHAGYGNDVIEGGTGNDILYGGHGSDTYIFNKGDGHDTIYDWTGEDRIVFGEGISKEDLQFLRYGNSLYINIKGTGEGITIGDWFLYADRKVERLVFADGTELSKEEVDDIYNKSVYELEGTEGSETLSGTDGKDAIYGKGGDDVIYGRSGDDQIEGGGGNDRIYAGYGNDVIEGGTGNDEIHAGYGNDVIEGGTGNDILYGGHGSDTYIFNKGDGHDTIYDWTGEDRIVFGEGISKSDLALFMGGNNLIIKYGNDDVITVGDQAYSGRGISTIQLQDGYFLTENDINRIIQEISAFADSNGISITSVDDIRNNQQLMNIIANAWHT